MQDPIPLFEGGNAVRFFAGTFSWKFPRNGSRQEGSAKKSSFYWDFLCFRGWELGVFATVLL